MMYIDEQKFSLRACLKLLRFAKKQAEYIGCVCKKKKKKLISFSSFFIDIFLGGNIVDCSNIFHLVFLFYYLPSY